LWIPAASGRLHPPVISMLGGNTRKGYATSVKRQSRQRLCSEFRHLRAKSRRKRRLRSEPRLRVQSAMIFACGKNPCTAHMRRPAVRGPDRCLQLFCRNKAQQESW